MSSTLTLFFETEGERVIDQTLIIKYSTTASINTLYYTQITQLTDLTTLPCLHEFSTNEWQSIKSTVSAPIGQMCTTNHAVQYLWSD